LTTVVIKDFFSNRRLVLVCLITAMIAVVFWSGSRVPTLSDKATLGGDLILEDPLSFDAEFPIDIEDPVLNKIFFTTVNWINTNKQGMSFGLLFAASIMTILSLLSKRGFSGYFSNTLLGLMIGAPLGVCVNCAAPIARGMHETGARLETTLVTMISSPTLNIIVLTMLFTTVPFYMAMIKLSITLLFLLGGIPLLARYVFNNELVAADFQSPANKIIRANKSNLQCELGQHHNWSESIKWVARNYLTNLWHIVKLTVPLMLFAGFLGAVAITLFPWQAIGTSFENATGLLLLVGIFLVALIGLILPVPIAFDVAIVSAMLAGGMPVRYCMILLFTLGTFSIYSFFILWTGISKKVAVVIAISVLLLGITAGEVTQLYLKWDEPRQQMLFNENYIGSVTREAGEHNESSISSSGITSNLETRSVGLRWQTSPIFARPGLNIFEAELNQTIANNDLLFTRHYGEKFGLDLPTKFSVSYRFITPFANNWPISSADIQGDGWIDLVMGTDQGIFIYINKEGKRFEKTHLLIPELADMDASNLALIDFNNDRQPDIFLSSYGGGNHIIYNDNGSFTSKGHYMLPDLGSKVLSAVAFADLDLNGDLDIIAGNWTAGRWTKIPPESSRNAIMWNEGGSFSIERLKGLPGETLSILVSDINADGNLDLLVGNDFAPADYFYHGKGNGKFELITRAHGLFPHAAWSTMSVDSGDVNNDLTLEIYTSQASGFTSSRPTKRAARLPLKPIRIACAEFDQLLVIGSEYWRQRCLTHLKQHRVIFNARQNRDPSLCLRIADIKEKEQCFAYIMLEKATTFDRNVELCDKFPEGAQELADICRVSLQPRPKYPKQEHKQALRQIRGRSMFYVMNNNQIYDDLSESMGVDIAGWSWSARFADMDNDEWSDLYVVNGHYRSIWRTTNVFFHNNEGVSFTDATVDTGMENYLSTGSYSYLDFDNDGDLDIVTISFDGPVWVYQNNSHSNQSILFELDDAIGNRFGVGSRIVIHYGPDGNRHQVRELKASGGFMSIDEPLAHFGMGDYTKIDRIEITWSTGEHEEIRGPFATGHRYRIARAAIQ
jgi:uncharacterized membrane protein YraQ (UPF0718 family)